MLKQVKSRAEVFCLFCTFMFRTALYILLLILSSCSIRSGKIILRAVNHTKQAPPEQLDAISADLLVKTEISKSDSIAEPTEIVSPVPLSSPVEVQNVDELLEEQSTIRKVVTEKSIRRKGAFSIAAGVAAVGLTAVGMTMAFAGAPLVILWFLGGLLLALFGLRLSISAKRDISTLTDRSTLKWLEKPATVGFIINVGVLILFGLLFLIVGVNLL